ncbi:MAG TPA: hypothetical protein VNX66_08885 [Candidatus Sulfotelmatobacter sp.]|jgi:hypothetical protein|nr:hypothetical protein [Candidatus Sulfotelmatobacter sp.]
MRKQLQRVAALFVVLGFAIGSANGQAGTPGIKVKVPFSFAVGQKTLSAGEYTVISSKEKIWVQEANGRNMAVLFTNSLDGRVPARDGRVVFKCYFGECFLSQVWIAGQEAGRRLPDSKRQLQLAKKGPGEEYALLGTATQR